MTSTVDDKDKPPHTGVQPAHAWRCITAYFAKYGVVRHQIEAYEHFMLMLLPHIIQESPDITVAQDDGTLHTVSLCNVSVRHPTNVEIDGKEYALLPHLARLRGLTYQCNVLVDVIHDIKCGDSLVERRVFREVLLCSLPCMLGSTCCYTQHQSTSCECRLDPGGYFIVSGVEKALIAQERLRTNFPFVFELRTHAKYAFQCEIRSCHHSKLRSTSTLYIYITKTKHGAMPEMLAELPFMSIRIPVHVLFRMLRVESLDDMVRLITGDVNSTDVRLLSGMLDSDASADMTTPELFEWLGREATVETSREKRQRYIEHIISNELLPHMGLQNTDTILQDKASFLGVMIRKLMRVYSGEIQADDRDHYSGKRIDPSGMGLLFRQLYRSHMKAVTVQMYRLREQGKLAFTNVSGLISARRITNAFRYAFATGNWGINNAKTSNSAQTGVVQIISRMTVVAALSNLRRINTPIAREGKAPKPRQLHHTSFGIVCGVETPEGVSCGLVKNLAMMTHVRVGTINSQELIAVLFVACSDTVTPLIHVSQRMSPSLVPILCNGTLCGYCADDNAAVTVLQRLRALRRADTLPFDTSISMVDGTIYIDSDAGCLLRPLFVGAFMHRLSEILVLEGAGATLHLWDILLRENVIEYVDKQEELSLRVGTWCNHPDATIYSHYELHPSLILGLCACLIPFPHRNQAPRNTYQSAMCKQAVSVFALNHMRRMDTVAHCLCDPQRPLVCTRMERILNVADAPTGLNAIVAIMVFKGYNQEDSIIFNEDAIQRGMFKTEKYTTVRDEERPNGGDAEKLQNPQTKECTGIRIANYSKISPAGTPAVGTPVNAGDVIIGKTLTTGSTEDIGKSGVPRKTVMRDRSTIQKSDSCVVDAILQSVKADGTRTVKVKTRSTRAPTVGDKFSSRMGQKGVIGRTFKQEDMPFTKDGIVPDIIVNPHAIPSRMTLGQLMECLLGKLCSITCEVGDATAFGDTSVEDVSDALRAEGFDGMGNETMYSGETGLAYEAKVFVGPTYYQRLKHIVSDKYHARSRGPLQVLTRQPLEGRSREGGLRFGEMERDCIISHGAHHVLLERLMYVSDAFPVWICGICGNFATPPATNTILRNKQAYCRVCEHSRGIIHTHVPYACKLLVQELSAMHIGVQLLT